MPLIYPESLVKIFQLKVGKITADRFQTKCPRKAGCIHSWTTETASLATLKRPLTLVSGLKKDNICERNCQINELSGNCVKENNLT